MAPHPTVITEIPELCEKTFLTSASAGKYVWIFLIAIILPAAGVSIGWAFALGNTQAKQAEKISVIENRQDKLDVEINRKLDVLINRGSGRE
jgi:hypothetical protein